MKMKYLWVVLSVLTFSGMAFAERMCITAPVANIRSGPGPDGTVLWKAEKYYPIDVLEKKGQWYYFKDFEGDEGWISGSLVGTVSSVITKKEKCNLRSGPGSDAKYSVIYSVEKGVPFRVIKEKGDWLHVEHADGDQGWLHKDLVW